MDNIIIDYKKQLYISLSTNINVKTLPCICTWTTIGSTVQNIFRTTLDNNIPKIIIPNPIIDYDRQLNYLKVSNNDNVSAIVLININSIDNPDYNMNIINIILSPKDVLYYNIKDGFYIIDYRGKFKNVQNVVEITSTPTVSGLTTDNILDYFTKSQINFQLLNKSNTGHTHPQYLTGQTIDYSQINLSGITNILNNYSLTGHTHTISELNGISITNFNSYTGITNAVYSKTAFGSIYEHSSGGTIISVSNTGTTGWKTAVANTQMLTTLTKNSKADRITILNGGSGTYQINVIVNAKFSSGVPIYSMGIYKNNILIPQAQSYVSPANSTDIFNLSTNTVISGVSTNDFFDARFTTNNATSRNITIYHMTFNINRIH